MLFFRAEWRASYPPDGARLHHLTHPGLVADALAGLNRLVAGFDDPRTPYRAVPRPERAPRYSDYGHLARVKEWSILGEGGE